jgi:hypothetical protein
MIIERQIGVSDLIGVGGEVDEVGEDWVQATRNLLLYQIGCRRRVAVFDLVSAATESTYGFLRTQRYHELFGDLTVHYTRLRRNLVLLLFCYFSVCIQHGCVHLLPLRLGTVLF